MSRKPISNIGLGSDAARGIANSSDPFNFPMPSRHDLMSLQTISAKADNTKTTTSRFTTVRNTSNNLWTSDIEGAVPKLHGSKVVNKPDFNNANWDIDRAGPRALHMDLYKVETNLTTGDIEGAQPLCNRFKSSRAGNDPLNPTYTLSKVEVRPSTPPRFIRDQMDVSDIDKAKPKENFQDTIKTREILKTDDIVGTKSIPRHKVRKTEFSALDYSDVTKKAKLSTRCSNPLDPVYTIADHDGKPCEIGVVDGAKPTRMPDAPKQQAVDRQGNLSTKDIEGAQCSTKGLGVFAHVTRRKEQMKSTSMDIKDIDGSGAGSLSKGVKTKRVGNPLDVNYQYPGMNELKNGENPFSLTRAEDAFNAKKTEAVNRETLIKAGAATLARKSDSGQTPWGINKVPEFKEKSFKESYGNFYNMDATAASKLDYNKLFQASRADGAGPRAEPGTMNPALKDDPNFKLNKKVFFEGKVSDTESVYKANQSKFYAANDTSPQNVGDKFGAIQAQINPNAEAFKQSACAFAGEDYQPIKIKSSPPKEDVNTKTGMYKKDMKQFYGVEKAETESQGSQFQRNAAVFMDTDMPQSGARPIHLDKNAPGQDFSKVKGNSVLNRERLQEHERQMERDPVYKKNMKRFYCLPSAATRSSVGPRSTAQKLDKFVS